MVVNASDIPPTPELVSHLDTALTAARQWMVRGSHAGPSDKELWENATYFPRVLLTRAADTMNQLGYAMQRDHEGAADDDLRARLADTAVAWLTVQPALERSREALRILRDTEPDWPGAQSIMAEARAQLNKAAQGVQVMLVAHDLGQVTRSAGERHLSLVREPEVSFELDHDAG